MNRPRFRVWAVFALTLCLLPFRAGATSVVAPDFDSLVSQADYVVRAVVKSVNSEWRIDGTNRSIITKVELTVSEVIKGSPPSPLVLEMLGGTIGQMTMAVDGAPKFHVGDEDILFIHGNGHQFSPLVGIMYGRYAIAHDSASGEDIVLRSNGSPLYDTQDVASPMIPVQPAASSPTAVRALTPAEFAGKIRASVAAHSPSPPANAN